MLKNITNLKGLTVLNKEQLKAINAGYTNCVKTGRSEVIYQPDNTLTLQPVAVAMTCEYRCQNEFLGMTGSVFGTRIVWGGC